MLVLWCYVLAMVSVKAIALDKEEKLLSSSNNYDYKDAIGKAILFFEGQRSGKLPPSQRVKWRGDSALSDGKPENACTDIIK